MCSVQAVTRGVRSQTSATTASAYLPSLVANETGDVSALLPVGFALGLALVHLFAGRLLLLDVIPRSRWLSLSGGVAVAYVFVHVLPEVQESGATIAKSGHALARFEEHVYLVVLVGFVAFYGLERFVQGSKSAGESGTDAPRGVFWIHIGSFAAYNGLIGYLLLHREQTGIAALTTYFAAMALHFVVNDYGLRDHHGRAYHRYGRWILSAAVFVGLAVGYVTAVSELWLALLFSFLAGGIILNVIKEELPTERQSRFWAFVLGVFVYSLVLTRI